MVAGGGNKLPFGNFPRLLLAWVSTEAVRTQSRELFLGRSLSEFMRALGVYSSSGGRGGVQTRLRNQMNRLFGCTVSLIYEDENGRATVNSLIADRTELWWTPNRPDQAGLWESKIELSEKFFQEIIRHPVPIDINTLTAIKRSTLGLDLYLWLVYRTFALRAPLRLSWRQVYRQFGAHPDNAHDKKTVSKLPHQGAARVEEDQDGLAGPELHHGSGRPDPASFDPGHRPSGSASTSKLEPQGSPLTAPPLKVVPGASYGVLLDRRHEVHPQVPVMRGSFPRLFGRPSSAASSPIRETPPPQFFAYSGDPYK